MTLGSAAPEWRKRQADLFAALDRPKAVLVFGYGSALGAGTQSHGALRYLTGWDSHEALSLFVYTETQGLLLLSSPFMENLAQAHFHNTQIIPAPVAHWGEIIARNLGQIGPLATVGFSEMPQAIYQRIRAYLPADRFIDADTPLALQRMSKSAHEINALERGAAICDDLFAALPAHLRSDLAASETQLDLEHRARRNGAEYCKTWLTIDRCADGPRYWRNEANQQPKPGDQVLFGIALTVDGYWAHGLRMGSIGPPTTNHRKLWSVVQEALILGQEALQQGAAASDPPWPPWPSPLIRGFRIMAGKAHVDFEPDMVWAHLMKSRSQPSPSRRTGIPTLWPEVRSRRSTSLRLRFLNFIPTSLFPPSGGAALGDMFLVEGAHARPLLQFPRGLMDLHIS